MNKNPVILLVEDEPAMREGLAHNLEFEGFEVRAAADGRSGLEASRAGDIDVAILDVMMPGMDGLELLRRMRDEGFERPAVFLTAKGQEQDKLAGFTAGADDYVTKPFSVLELIARVKAILRRAELEWEASQESPASSLDGVEIEDLGLTDKTCRLLHDEGIDSAGDLMAWSDADLRRIPQLGPGAVREIRLAISDWLGRLSAAE